MFHVSAPEKAMAILREHFSRIRTGAEEAAVPESIGRVLSGDVRCIQDIPAFDRSTVDGYAVRAEDTFGASETMPAMLRLAREIRMGQPPGEALKDGECAAIPTGGALPEGADAVVMVEQTEEPGDGYVYINKPAAPAAGVIFKGDDAKAGETVLKAGRRITPMDAGAMAAAGLKNAPVAALPKVGIISTGDEIAAAGEPLDWGKVYDVNAPTLAAGLRGYGIPVRYGIIRDDLDTLSKTIERAHKECDMVLVSGGSSVGTRDNTLKAIEKLEGAEALFHGLAVKPGKPTICFNAGGKPIFGLPGHPVSSYMIFLSFVRPVLCWMTGETPKPVRTIPAVLALDCPSNHGREEYLPVQLEDGTDGLKAIPVSGKSGLITTLCKAEGFIVISRESEGLAKGQPVQVFLF
jgi:molybdopterin molybdotransferase